MSDVTNPLPPQPMLETMGNLSHFHHEHEKFYSQAPLRSAQEVQAHSRALKSMASHWSSVEPVNKSVGNKYAGAIDLNAPGLIEQSGILFMESDAEPVEIGQLKREIQAIATDNEQAGTWLIEAMEQSWNVAQGLIAFPALADLLGERHRIVANNWQSASMFSLAGKLMHRALDVLNHIELVPSAVRKDLANSRRDPAYLYSASELLDRAADLLTECATLIHDNERRWRVFSQRVQELRSAQSTPA